jgi:hypothetical protein
MGLIEGILANELETYKFENEVYEDWKKREPEMLAKVRKESPKQTRYEAACAVKRYLVEKFGKDFTKDLEVWSAKKCDETGYGRNPALVWEGGPFEWAIGIACYVVEAGVNTDRVYCEPEYTFMLLFCEK